MIKKKWFLLCIIFVVLAVSGISFGGEALPYADGEILVKFREQVRTDSARTAQALKASGADVIRHLPHAGLSLVKVAGQETVEAAVKRLMQHPDIEYAEPNYRRYAMALTPNDPLYSSQWGLLKIQAPAAWSTGQGNKSVIVAMPDTGIDINHPDLNANLWLNTAEICNNGIDDDFNGFIDDCYGANIITKTGNGIDDEGHGTHVAGIIGAVGNNGVGVAGVNWFVSLMALKFMAANGIGSVADELDAINYAKLKGARVVNMSFGSSDPSEFERQAMAGASSILFAAAACNNHQNSDIFPCYPASYDLPNIISVAATDQNDNLASFSNYGPKTVAVAAPGVDIESTFLGSAYQLLSGTSMSTPFVSGLAALILSQKPSLTPSQVKDRILRTADVVPALQGKLLTSGRINAYRALTETITGPFIYSLSPTTGSVGATVTIKGSNFTAVAGQVLFGGNTAATITSWTPDTIVVTVPAGAVSGPVRVVTAEGTSNSVSFTVSALPTMVRILIPYGSSRDGKQTLLILSNPFDHPLTVAARFAGASGKNLIMSIPLAANEKVIYDMARHFTFANDTFFMDLRCDEFFAAIALMVDTSFKRPVFIPSIMGQGAPFDIPVR